MRVVPAELALHDLLPPVHILRRLLFTDGALFHSLLVLPAVIAQRVVLRQRVVVIRQVQAFLDISLVVVLVCTALLALEAQLALPLLRDIFHDWVQAVGMERPLTVLAEAQFLLVSGLSADLAALTV